MHWTKCLIDLTKWSNDYKLSNLLNWPYPLDNLSNHGTKRQTHWTKCPIYMCPQSLNCPTKSNLSNKQSNGKSLDTLPNWLDKMINWLKLSNLLTYQNYKLSNHGTIVIVTGQNGQFPRALKAKIVRPKLICPIPPVPAVPILCSPAPTPQTLGEVEESWQHI